VHFPICQANTWIPVAFLGPSSKYLEIHKEQHDTSNLSQERKKKEEEKEEEKYFL
jgi:hypothetical protein